MRTMLLLMFVLVVPSAQAEVYRWVDEDGTVHFSDTPREAGQTRRIDVGEINTAKSVDVETIGTDEMSAKATEVVLYSASWCGNCDRARAYFQQNDVPFVEYDVEDSRKGRRDFAAMGGKAVPIIVVGDSRMVGFSPERFEQLYDV